MVIASITINGVIPGTAGNMIITLATCNGVITCTAINHHTGCRCACIDNVIAGIIEAKGILGNHACRTRITLSVLRGITKDDDRYVRYAATGHSNRVTTHYSAYKGVATAMDDGDGTFLGDRR